MSDARELLRELLAEALAGTNGDGERVIPQVPPPPVAAVHRPTGHNPQVGVRPLVEGLERIVIGGDDDLNRFARDLLARPDRDAILAGRVRFTLGPGGPAAGGATRIERGAVTERAVAAAAKGGGRLVLGPRAVLTPLAREKARALGVDIERES